MEDTMEDDYPYMIRASTRHQVEVVHVEDKHVVYKALGNGALSTGIAVANALNEEHRRLRDGVTIRRVTLTDH